MNDEGRGFQRGQGGYREIAAHAVQPERLRCGFVGVPQGANEAVATITERSWKSQVRDVAQRERGGWKMESVQMEVGMSRASLRWLAKVVSLRGAAEARQQIESRRLSVEILTGAVAGAGLLEQLGPSQRWPGANGTRWHGWQALRGIGDVLRKVNHC